MPPKLAERSNRMTIPISLQMAVMVLLGLAIEASSGGALGPSGREAMMKGAGSNFTRMRRRATLVGSAHRTTKAGWTTKLDGRATSLTVLALTCLASGGLVWLTLHWWSWGSASEAWPPMSCKRCAHPWGGWSRGLWDPSSFLRVVAAGDKLKVTYQRWPRQIWLGPSSGMDRLLGGTLRRDTCRNESKEGDRDASWTTLSSATKGRWHAYNKTRAGWSALTPTTSGAICRDSRLQQPHLSQKLEDVGEVHLCRRDDCGLDHGLHVREFAGLDHESILDVHEYTSGGSCWLLRASWRGTRWVLSGLLYLVTCLYFTQTFLPSRRSSPGDLGGDGTVTLPKSTVLARGVRITASLPFSSAAASRRRISPLVSTASSLRAFCTCPPWNPCGSPPRPLPRLLPLVNLSP